MKPQGSLRILFLLCFLFRRSPPKLFSKLVALKFCKILLENPQRISVLVAGHRPSYLLNCVACCPWNFEAVLKYLRLIAVIKSSQGRFSIKKAVLKNFGKHLCWSPRACNFIKKRLRHRRFPVNITKTLRTPILKTSANGCFVQLSCFIYHHFPNLYRIISSSAAFITTQHILHNIS